MNMNNIIPDIKFIDNLNPVNFECTYLFDKSCIETSDPESLHEMFSFTYGGNYMKFYWQYNKEMNKIYVKAKVKNRHMDEKFMQLIYGCDFNEENEFRVEINRARTSFETKDKRSFYKWMSNIDTINVIANNKIIIQQEFYSNNTFFLDLGYIFIFGDGINYYKNKIN